MPLTAQYNPETDIVETVQSGALAKKDLVEETERGIELVKAHRCSRWLCDYSRSIVDVPDIDVMALPSLQEDLALPRSTRIAVLSPQGDRGKELAAFYETVSRNRGWKAKIFDDRDEAIAWLTSDGPTR